MMRFERVGPAAWIRWSRPERLNAFDPEALDRLGDLLAEAGSSDARAIVCFGEGGAFSSGDDLRATAAMDSTEWRRTLEAFNRLTREIVAAPQPVIAAVDGVCVGGSFEFAFACDVRVATPRSLFGCPEVAIGLSISNGFSLLAPRAARRLVLTGELVDAEGALRLGLVDLVVEDPEAEAQRLADRIAALAPLAVAGSKRLLDERAKDLLERALDRERDLCTRLFETADAREGLAAFLEKRPPTFEGR
ncbi:MAG TPA: enoyl-CoA hydratase/isomerase family protein [Gaiellaceae bacterium]|jgi:enoyl-CoA hydratase|nr:enoyl-CoA hydratase/isomerase family protein [Gaiellaceae bacterium]